MPFQVSRPFHGPLLGLPKRLHKALIASAFAEVVVGHISRDSTAIAAREKPQAKTKESKPKTTRKRGRPRKAMVLS